MKLWAVTGINRRNLIVTVGIRAKDHNEAVRKGSRAPYMLVVRDVMLVD